MQARIEVLLAILWLLAGADTLPCSLGSLSGFFEMKTMPLSAP